MAVFGSRTLKFLAGVLVLLALCVFECSSQGSQYKPVISSVYPFVVGRNKTVTCSYLSLIQAGVTNPLTFAIDGGQIKTNPTVTPVIGSTTMVTYSLRFDLLLSANDNGKVFRCTAANGRESTWTLTVVKPPDKPVITGPRVIRGGENYTWTCYVDGASKQVPSVYWQYDTFNRITGYSNVQGTYVDPTSGLVIFNMTSTLELSKPIGSADFNLECVASHIPTSGTDPDAYPTASIRVIVTDPPLILGGNITYTVTEGTTFTIDCRISANTPATSITWYKDNVRIVTTAGRYTGGTVSSPSLVISSIARSDVGTYVCEAANSYGTSKGSDNKLKVRYLPVITYSDNPASGQAGSSVTLACVIDAYPAVTTVFWYKVNTFTNGETQIKSSNNPSKYSGGTKDTPGLTILNLEPSDATDRYRCKADNDVGRGTGGLLELQIVYLFVTTSNVTSYTRNETQSLKIPCSYDGNPPVTSVEWTWNGQLINTNNPMGKYSGSTLTEPSLTIHSLTRQDSGVYVCSASNGDDKQSSKDVTVTVNFLPLFENNTQINLNDTKGSTITLQCQASANPPPLGLQWYKNGNPLNVTTGRYSGGTLTSPDLTIAELESGDSGSYFCRVSNIVGTTVSPEIFLDIQYSPEILSAQTPVTASESSGVNIPCTYDANPFPTNVTWTKDGVPVNFTSVGYVGGTPGTPGLTINSLVPSDAGTYVCKVVNSLGSVSTAGILLTVTYKPKITPENPTDVSGSEAESVTLLCTVAAVPAATSVQWTHDNDDVDLRNSVKYQGGTTASPSLTIKDLQISDAGSYRCQVSNTIGTSYGGNHNLTVKFRPEITVQPSASAREPQAVTLVCQIKAIPAVVNLVWKKNSKVLNTSDATRYSGGTTSNPSLTILSVRAEDVGSYNCEASNSVGTTTSGTINLSVEYLPVITVTRTQVGGDAGQTLTLELSVNANPALTSVQWLKRAAGSTVDTVVDLTTGGGNKYAGGTTGNPSLVINNLAVTDAGSYKMRAVNVLGTRETVYIVVATSYRPTKPTISGLAASYKENELISLTCSASGFPEPEYRWLRGSVSAGVGSTLAIAQASSSDNGQLKCEAYNEKGTSSSTVTINVLYKPRAGSSLRNVTTSIGSTETLVCTTDSNPEPTGYQWFHAGQLLPTADQRLRVAISNSTMLGSYYCVATNSEGESDRILVFVSTSADTGGGRTGQSTEDSGGLKTSTIVLIVIICLIILVIVVLIIIYCCTTRRCFKKDNDVSPQRPAAAPVVVPYTAKSSDRVMNGHVPSAPNTYNDRIKLDEEKANGVAPVNHGLIISVPSDGTPRPHHLPPLGEDGVAEMSESAREEKPTKKKKRRRRHREDNEDGSPRRHRRRHHREEGGGNDDEAVA